MQYIIGDLHANARELKKLVDLLRPATGDTVIFLGDYINKNQHTRETIELLYELKEKTRCIFIKGNHDFVWERYINYGETARQAFLLRYGGVEALREFTRTPERVLKRNETARIKGFLNDYLDLISQMCDFYIVDQYLALHAGLLPGQLQQNPLQFQERNYFLREADIDFKKKYLDRYTIVAGHTHFGTEPMITPAYINLDLGAGYGYYVGALCVEEQRIVRSDGKHFKLSVETT